MNTERWEEWICSSLFICCSHQEQLTVDTSGPGSWLWLSTNRLCSLSFSENGSWRGFCCCCWGHQQQCQQDSFWRWAEGGGNMICILLQHYTIVLRYMLCTSKAPSAMSTLQGQECLISRFVFSSWPFFVIYCRTHVHSYTLYSHHWLIPFIDCTRSRKQLNLKFKVISLSGQGQVGCMEWKEGDGAGKANVQPTGKVWKLMDRLIYRFAIGSFWWLIFDNV